MSIRTLATILVGIALVGLGRIPVARGQEPSYPAQWDSMSPRELADLSVQYQLQGRIADWKQLAGYVAGRYERASAAGSIDWDAWLPLLSGCGRYQEPSVKVSMAEDIVQNLAGDDGSIRQLSGQRVVWITATLRHLGRAEQACSICATWIASFDDLGALSGHDLSALARVLATNETAGAAGRVKIAKCLKEEFLADVSRCRSIGSRCWDVLAENVLSVLSSGDRTYWAERLIAAFAVDQTAVAELGGEDFAYLTEALLYLDGYTARRLSESWVKQHPNWTWPQATGRLLQYITYVLKETGQHRAASRIAANWAESSAEGLEEAFIAQEPTYQDCITVARAWDRKGDSMKAEQWAVRAYQTVLNCRPLNVSALHRIGILFKELGLIEGREYPDFAGAVASLAAGGDLSEESGFTFEGLAQPCVGPRSRSILEAQLTDPAGQPRMAVAKLLAWSYRLGGELTTWQASLEQRINTTRDPDAKARWMVVRAYAASIASYDPHPLGGKVWLDRALATAGSETCRLEALRELVSGYCGIGKHSAALVLLDSVAGQFSLAESSQALSSLRAETEQAKAMFQVQQLQFKLDHAKRIAATKASGQ